MRIPLWSIYWPCFLILPINLHVTSLPSWPSSEDEPIGTISVTTDFDLGSTEDGSCFWGDLHSCQEGKAYRDSRLFPMEVPPRISGEENTTSTFHAYIEPDVALMYNATPGSIKPLETSYNGVFAKFVNLSSRKVKVDWEERKGGNRIFQTTLNPFSGGSTASFPGHRFVVYDDETNEDLVTWIVQKGNSLYTYDPYQNVELLAEQMLSPEDFKMYKLQLDNLKFSDIYEKFTGRQWIALYKRKYPPRYPMWPADSFGQTHVISTRESHLIALPPPEVAMQTTTPYGSTYEERQKLNAYREPNQGAMLLLMTVVSVAPRVFEIPNFLSQAEVNHILEVATGLKLGESTTGSNAATTTKALGRTSRNSWIRRNRSIIIDSIYRRAADLLQIDESLFRMRMPNETHMIPESKSSITEPLQLVHYAEGQQYTPHHDFMIPDLKEGQPTRFATVLFYLNEPEMGGETSFPRWLNGKENKILTVKPEIGKAVLFYNQLPDGNYDERSLHAAKLVFKGEKWLTNLWVWDPYKS